MEVEIIGSWNKLGGDKGLKWSNAQESPSKALKTWWNGYSILCVLPSQLPYTCHLTLLSAPTQRRNTTQRHCLLYTICFNPWSSTLHHSMWSILCSLITYSETDRQTDLGSLCPCRIGREILIPICMLKIPHRLHLHDGLCCRLCCVPPSSQTPLNAHIFTLASLKASPSSEDIPVPPKPSPWAHEHQCWSQASY